MARYNATGHRPQPAVARATSPLGTISKTAPDTATYEGAPGWAKDPRTDLFLRATSSFHGNESSFYESGQQRDEKIIGLVRQLAVEDWDWTSQFLPWLRTKGNIRTASLMLAAEAVDARLKSGVRVPENSVAPTHRQVIASVLQRADEPGEMLAYWLAAHGRALPMPVKRGIADGASRLYSTKSFLKYDTGSHAVRFADVLELCHATPRELKGVQRSAVQIGEDGELARTFMNNWQGDLFKYAIDRRHNRAEPVPESLGMLRQNQILRDSGDPKAWLNADTLKAAGMTWEDSLSAVGSKTDKAKLWEAMIPEMGYMALLRNLRNFDEAGVGNLAAQFVSGKLADPEQVAKSRQLPFRFLSAYRAAPSLRWGQALETALDLCLANVPELPGRTLVLVDSSGSMSSMMSGKSTLSCLSAAAVFGAVSALRNYGNADLFHFADGPEAVPVPKGGSILRLAKDVEQRQGRVGHGTRIAESVRRTYCGHDRVLIFSDGARFGIYGSDAAAAVPDNVPVYLFNLRGYSASPMPTGSAARFDLGGLTDATFALIPRLEQGMSGVWPWELENSDAG